MWPKDLTLHMLSVDVISKNYSNLVADGEQILHCNLFKKWQDVP